MTTYKCSTPSLVLNISLQTNQKGLVAARNQQQTFLQGYNLLSSLPKLTQTTMSLHVNFAKALGIESLAGAIVFTVLRDALFFCHKIFDPSDLRPLRSDIVLYQ